MNKYLNRERLIGIVTFVIGIAIYIGSVNLPQARQDPVGPTLFPKFIGAAIAVISVIHILISNEPDKEDTRDRNWLELLYLLASVSIYLLVMMKIGFVISTIALLLALTLHFDKRPLKEKLLYSVLFSVIFTAFLYLVFAKALGVLLPTLIL